MSLVPFLVVCRFPLLLAAALVALPAFALSTARPLLGNLFTLRRGEIALVSLLATLASWVVMVTLQIFVHYAPARLGVAPLTAGWLGGPLGDWRLVLFGLLAAPIVVAAVWRSPGPRLASLGAAALGVGAAALLFFASAGLHFMLRDPARPAADLLVPAEARLFAPLPALRALAPRAVPRQGSGLPPMLSAARPGLAGYRLAGGRVGPGHLLAAVYFVLSAAIYGLAFALFRPGRRLLPALAYLLQLLVVLGWALPGISFWLDRYRVPVVPLLAAVSFLASRVFDTDHYYRIAWRGAAPPGAPSPAPPAAFGAAERAASAGREQPIVVVAASGGGSAAGLWTAKVLTSLQRELGEAFTRSIRLISAVSGGSVGALFFLDRFTAGGVPEPGSLDGIVAAAGRQSLDAAAWGLAYPDLWRILGLRWGDPALDRGWAMEQVWRQSLLHPAATLGDWRTAVAEGWLPATVFNATTVETGEQFLLSPLDLEGWQARRFAGTYPGYDVDAVTAARISASFPWVSPVARPLASSPARPLDRPGDRPLDRLLDHKGRPAVPGFHLGDGGYYDNFGVVTAVNWLLSLDPAQQDEIRRRGLLLVLIRAYPEDAARPLSAARRAWLYSLLGPVLALMRVRSTTQSVRNGVDLGLLEQVWTASGIRHLTATFAPGARAPLTWKLAPAEKAAIESAWDEPANRSELAAMRAFCGGV